jgi:hypothetical protein
MGRFVICPLIMGRFAMARFIMVGCDPLRGSEIFESWNYFWYSNL